MSQKFIIFYLFSWLSQRNSTLFLLNLLNIRIGIDVQLLYANRVYKRTA